MKDKDTIWSRFAAETGGKFVKRKEAWLSDRTEINYKGWSIFFDHFIITSGKFGKGMTRVIVPIIPVDDFRFEIYRKSFVRKVEKIFGAQDIEIGRPEFDKAFIIKSNNEFKVKTLLQHQKIRSLIEAQEDLNLVITDESGIWEGVHLKDQLELAFYANGWIENFDVLKSLLCLFEELLHNLEAINAIKEPVDCSL